MEHFHTQTHKKTHLKGYILNDKNLSLISLPTTTTINDPIGLHPESQENLQNEVIEYIWQNMDFFFLLINNNETVQKWQVSGS